MSFHIDFIAGSVDDARRIVAKEYLPPEVRVFIDTALTAFKDETAVQIKAIGHLYNSDSDYRTSTANIQVNAITFKKPIGKDGQG